MKFVNDHAMEDLAKSSTILQCIIAMLDFECNKFHYQPEVLTVINNVATIDLDPMNQEEIMEACMKVNKHFIRKDKRFTCVPMEHGQGFVKCEAGLLSDYDRLA